MPAAFRPRELKDSQGFSQITYHVTGRPSPIPICEGGATTGSPAGNRTMTTRGATSLSPMQLDQLSINTIRFLSVDAVQQAKSGHPGLPLGAAPMAYVVWTRFLQHNP